VNTAELLFVYGTLRPGIAPAAVADLVAGLRIMGDARARGRLYNLGPYPGAILDAATPTHVFGVVLELPSPPPWPRLDDYEGYDPANPAASLYIRRRCEVELTDGSTVRAWVYEYNRPVSDSRLIPSGRYDRAMPTKRPVIGVTMDHEDDEPSGPPGSSGYYKLAFDYCAAIEKAGGLPLAVPYRTDAALIPQFVDLLDGILFTGGNDLDPALYGQQWHPRAAKIDPQRQSFEMALLAEVERRRVPALFVCLGCQLLNVYRGGSLTQFLPDEQGTLEHRRGEREMRRHEVKIVDADSALGRAIGAKEISANTYHKQAVNQLGRGLRIVAKAPDGVVEAMEDPAYPMMVAVQWHPERLTNEREHLAPFRLLVEKATAAGRSQERAAAL
jgi:putative glutamine amidotransferase